MQQHGRADADSISLNGGDDRLADLADGFDRAMGGTVDGALTAGLACEVGEIVAGGEAVAVALEKYHTDGGILPAAAPRISGVVKNEAAL